MARSVTKEELIQMLRRCLVEIERLADHEETELGSGHYREIPPQPGEVLFDLRALMERIRYG